MVEVHSFLNGKAKLLNLLKTQYMLLIQKLQLLRKASRFHTKNEITYLNDFFPVKFKVGKSEVFN